MSTDKRLGVEASGGKKVVSFQWLRFFAAMFVLMYHASVFLFLIRKDEWAINLVPQIFGIMGVNLFFSLSGLLMSLAIERQDASKFLLHRVGRIYPTYYIVVAIFAFSTYFNPLPFPSDWRALTLMSTWNVGFPLGVEWTLVFEVTFYVFVFLIVALGQKKHAVAILIIWLLAILVHNFVWPDDPSHNMHRPFSLPFSGYNVAFAAGMLLPLVCRAGIHPIAAALAAVVLFVTSSRMGLPRWGLGLGSAVFVYSLWRFQGLGWLFGSGVLGRVGGRLGDYAFAIYLCHVPIILSVYYMVENTSHQMLFVYATAASLFVGTVLGEVDRFTYRIVKRRIDNLMPGTRRLLAAMYLVTFVAGVGLAGWHS